jgi:hypothetical protein
VVGGGHRGGLPPEIWTTIDAWLDQALASK